MSELNSNSDLSQHLDIAALDELKEVMEEEFGILLQTFIEDSDIRLEDMRRAIENSKSDELLKSAHSFKGSCGNIGAFQLSELCKQAEQMGRDVELGKAPDLFKGIESEYKIVRDALEAELKNCH